MYKNCKLILTNYYYKSITNTLAVQINKKHVRTLLVIKTKMKHKKRMNIALQIYKQIYVPILYVTRMTQNKNDSISSILQHGCVVGKNCCVLVQDFHIWSCVLDRAN